MAPTIRRSPFLVAAIAAWLGVATAAQDPVRFAAPVLLPLPQGLAGVAAADLDGDGDVDIVTHGLGLYIMVLHGRGDGTFEPPVTYDEGGSPLALALGDVTGNGKPDIVAADSFHGTVTVMANNGDGTFGKPIIRPAGIVFPRALALGDLDADGDLDCVVGDGFARQHVVLLNGGKGDFAAPRVIAGANTTIDAALADFDRDGDLDAVMAFQGMSVRLNDGRASFAPPLVLSGGQFTAVVATDLDGDGDADIAATRTVSGAGDALEVFENRGSGGFAQRSFAIDNLARDVAAADLDGDGDIDLVTAHVSPLDLLMVLLNDGAGRFHPPLRFPAGIYPQSVAVAELDGDGRPDLLAALQFETPRSVAILRNRTALTTDTTVLSVATGGTQTMLLDGGTEHAGRSYLLLGSLSGHTPGFQVGTWTVPLNPDGYLFATLLQPNQPPLSGSCGNLDGEGLARARFTIPAGLPFAGLTLHHAFGVLDGGVRFVSNPARLRLVR